MMILRGGRRMRPRVAPALVLALAWAWCTAARAVPPGVEAPLTLDEVLALAAAEQPRVMSLAAEQRAAQASGVAARQLPDPQIRLGVADWPVSTRDALSFTRDTDTQVQVGLSQEFTRAEKRRLRGELFERESERLGAETHLTERTIRRDAVLAWLDVWRYERSSDLAKAAVAEAELLVQAVRIALETGGATQADYLGARLETGRLADTVHAARQKSARARVLLARWIGDAASRPVAESVPRVPSLPPLAVALDRVRTHPHLAGAAARLAAANTGVALAQAAYRPDWRVELDYGDRPAYSNMVSVQVGIDLPLFRAARQDQGMLSALAQRQAAEAAQEDAGRELEADVRSSVEDAQHLSERLTQFDANLLPEGQARIEAALVGWRAGRAQFRDVLDARRVALDLATARLEVQGELLKTVAVLTYYGAYGAATTAEDAVDE